MNIQDYIPIYPDLTAPEFNNDILHKREFYDLRTGESVPKLRNRGDLWPHQGLLGRFLAPETIYTELLLFHTPGTGKTCAATAAAEVNLQDPLVRKPLLIVVPNDTLKDQWEREIVLTCTKGQYIPERYFSTDPATRLTAGQKIRRLRKNIMPFYHITTIERLSRYIDTLTDESIYKRFSNTIIIIDEAHNLRIQAKTTNQAKQTRKRYNSYHRFLHLVENSKKILLTATPMVDTIKEIAGLMNLLLPLDNQLPTGAAFSKKFIQKTDQQIKIINQSDLAAFLVGRVSYIREGGTFPTRINKGTTTWTNFIPLVGAKMSKLQVAGYLQAKAKDTKGKASGLSENSRQAASFVYKTADGEYLWGKPASKLLVIKSKRSITIEQKKISYERTMIKQDFRTELTKNLAEYSSKYHYIINFIKEHPDEPIYIFTPLVSGTGGALFLGNIIELFGYSRAIGGARNPQRRVAVITGEDKSSLQRRRIIETFNAPENANAQFIHVLIGTLTIAEGASFINVRHEIVVSPYWNNSVTEQAIGRGLRINSLKGIPPDQRKVTVTELAAYSDRLPEKTIDIHMYQLSENKDIAIKKMERVLKAVAWDCALNYGRNVRPDMVRKSRECDYQRCNYKCYQTQPEKLPDGMYDYSVPQKDLSNDTYLLYYSSPEIDDLVLKIKRLLRHYAVIDLNKLYELLDSKMLKLVILAIEYIIENHETMYNKWGQPCFLHSDGNILYLSDIPDQATIDSSWYTRHPYVNKITSLSSIISDQLIEQDLARMDKIDTSKPKQTLKTIKNMSIDSQIILLETLMTIEKDVKPPYRKRLDVLLDAFNDNMFIINAQRVHNLEKTKLQQDYVDMTKAEFGNLKCLKEGRWQYCDKKEEELLSAEITAINRDKYSDITENEYKVYAIISGDVFKIADKRRESKAARVDRRVVIRGSVCTEAGWKKWQLIELILYLGIKIKVDVSISNKKELVTAIEKKKLAQAIPKKADLTTLQKIYTLSGYDKKKLCPILRRWFEKKKLVIYE